MGYDCSAALSYEVDNISLDEVISDVKKATGKNLEKLNEISNSFNIVHEELRNKKVLINLEYEDSCFFNDVSFYVGFTSGGNFNSNSGSSLDGKHYTGTYEILEFIDSDRYIHNPIKVLDILIFSYFFSKKLPECTIQFGLGDSALFWADFTLKNGILQEFSHEDGDDGEEAYGFICTEDEMKSFFKSLKELNG